MATSSPITRGRKGGVAHISRTWLNGLLAAMAAGLAGCASALAADGSPVAVLRTHQAEYVVTRTSDAYSAEIGFTYVNRGDRPLYIPKCRVPRKPILEKLEGDRWIYAVGYFMQDCLGPSFRIDPRETWTDTLRIYAGTPDSRVIPKFNVEEVPGTYRLVLQTVWDRAEGPFLRGGEEDLLPLALRVSNPFRIRVEHRQQ